MEPETEGEIERRREMFLANPTMFFNKHQDLKSIKSKEELVFFKPRKSSNLFWMFVALGLLLPRSTGSSASSKIVSTNDNSLGFA